MTHETINSYFTETVPLQNAVLCVDCELITSSRCDTCPVCGGHSLLGIAAIIGGTLVEHRNNRKRNLVLFDLSVSIDMAEIEAGEMGAVIDGLSRVVAPKLPRASLHIRVEPVSRSAPVRLKVA